jgi:hypothetical protein
MHLVNYNWYRSFAFRAPAGPGKKVPESQKQKKK